VAVSVAAAAVELYALAAVVVFAADDVAFTAV
jgi:hypothetical protein